MNERPIGSDGLNAGERQILALWDAGLSIEQIVDRVEYSPNRVHSIVEYYAAADEERRTNGALIAANARYVAAIAATGRSFG